MPFVQASGRRGGKLRATSDFLHRLPPTGQMQILGYSQAADMFVAQPNCNREIRDRDLVTGEELGLLELSVRDRGVLAELVDPLLDDTLVQARYRALARG